MYTFAFILRNLFDGIAVAYSNRYTRSRESLGVDIVLRRVLHYFLYLVLKLSEGQSCQRYCEVCWAMAFGELES